MYTDPSGHFVIMATMIWAAIGASIGFGAAYIPDLLKMSKPMDFNGVI